MLEEAKLRPGGAVGLDGRRRDGLALRLVDRKQTRLAAGHDGTQAGAMGYPAKLLNPGEQVVLDVRPHWKYLDRPLFAATVVLAGACYAIVASVARWAAVALACALAVCLLWLVARYLRWAATSLVVTSQRLVLRKGVFGRDGPGNPPGPVERHLLPPEPARQGARRRGHHARVPRPRRPGDLRGPPSPGHDPKRDQPSCQPAPRLFLGGRGTVRGWWHRRGRRGRSGWRWWAGTRRRGRRRADRRRAQLGGAARAARPVAPARCHQPAGVRRQEGRLLSRL